MGHRANDPKRRQDRSDDSPVGAQRRRANGTGAGASVDGLTGKRGWGYSAVQPGIG
jgi:hypothetical protein